jgi:hypothetical protein
MGVVKQRLRLSQAKIELLASEAVQQYLFARADRGDFVIHPPHRPLSRLHAFYQRERYHDH